MNRLFVIALVVAAVAVSAQKPTVKPRIMKSLPKAAIKYIPRGTLNPASLDAQALRDSVAVAKAKGEAAITTTAEAVDHLAPAVPDPKPEAIAAAAAVVPPVAPNEATLTLRAGTPVPNTAKCIAAKGACGDRTKCAGTLVTGLCTLSWVCCVPTGTTPAAPVVTTPGPLSPAPVFTKEYLTGKFDPARHPDFVPTGTGVYIRKEAMAAYRLMAAAAKKDLGLTLSIVSATRNFAAQKDIWDRKWNTDPLYKNIADKKARAIAIMTYSSMPATSQHHLGASFDLWSVKPSDFTGTANGRKLDAWFAANAKKFGFCRPYSPKSTRGNRGYNEEQWHVTYKPLYIPALAQYKQKVTYADISGFSGSEFASQIRAIEDYVSSVAAECLTY